MRKIILIMIAVFLCLSVPVTAAEETEPNWQDETIYSIVVDRFNNGDTNNDKDVDANDLLAYNGGDFQGIIDELDYIHDMGFTAIRLTPIFDNAPKGYHGYWVEDFYKVDEHFGTMKKFQQLVKEAHKRDMKVIMDFVTNNVAESHEWVGVYGKRDWFNKKAEISEGSTQQANEEGWVNGLPDLNQNNPEVSKYLIQAANWWINKTDIDGYSLPEINHVPVSFWSEFSAAVKKEKDGFFLVGVPADNRSIHWEQYESAGIDSLFDYSYSEKLRGVFANTNRSFEPLILEEKENSLPSASFFDNEFTPRFTKDIVDERQFPGSRWKTALTYLYTAPGIPVVYYGTEIALNGGETPDNRGLMSFRAEKELMEYITKLGELRNKLPSLTRGTMELLYDKEGMAIYKREYQGETSIIAINNTRESQKVTLTSDQLQGGKELRGLLAGDLVRAHKDEYNIIIDRDNSEVYVMADKSGLNLPLISAVGVSVLLILVFLFMIIKRSKRNIVE
jgi:glycosidase